MVLFACTMVGSIANYLFRVIMGQLLGPAQFGELGALLALFAIASVPAITISSILAKYVSGFNALGDRARIRSFYEFMLRRIFF
ncbi:MAG: hypothetical protein KAI64_00680, partial [Thermoplasmata archaeon]|nr:hypothetical protein [Thermoplasmata archaeon]